jgi:hypothetical protein
LEAFLKFFSTFWSRGNTPSDADGVFPFAPDKNWTVAANFHCSTPFAVPPAHRNDFSVVAMVK